MFRDQPRKMGIDLLIRGHHKVGQFLDGSKLPACLKDKVQDKITKYEFNYWSLKMMAQWGSQALPDLEISRLVKVIYHNR